MLSGGAGANDTVTYASADGAVTVNLALQGATMAGIAALAIPQSVYSYADDHGAIQTVHDTLSGFENIVGSQFNDTLSGDDNGNLIQGGNGDDAIVGAGGNDRLYGNVGNDLIQAGDGDDYVNGGQGNDRLYGNVGNDELHGGLGDDYLNGGQGNDVLYGEAGTNTLVGGFGADRFVMSLAGNDTITDFGEASGDKIDLSGIDAIAGNASPNDHFTYAAGGAFTNFAGQLIVVATDATHYLVEGDTNGDGVADFTIHVTSPDGAAPDRNAFTGLAADAGAATMVAHATPHDAFLFG